MLLLHLPLLLLGLGALIVAIGIAGNRTFPMVVLLYSLLGLEGFLAGLYVFGREDVFRDRATKPRNNDRFEPEPLPPNRIVSSLTWYLRSASQGSEFSRREVASILDEIITVKLAERGRARGGGAGPAAPGHLGDDEQLRSDIERVVRRYLSLRKADEAVVGEGGGCYWSGLRRLVMSLAHHVGFVGSDEQTEK